MLRPNFQRPSGSKSNQYEAMSIGAVTTARAPDACGRAARGMVDRRPREAATPLAMIRRLAAETVSVVSRVRPLTASKSPLRSAQMPNAALAITEAIKILVTGGVMILLVLIWLAGRVYVPRRQSRQGYRRP
jgi:hypothetical protein